MKPIKNIWDRFIEKENLRQAIIDASKRKMKNRAVRRVMNKLDYYTDILHDILASGRFTLSPVRKEEIETEYGKKRLVTKRKFFPDRCVEHAIERVLGDIWRRSTTTDMYACMKGRGINCKDRRHNFNHKMKRAISGYRGKTAYVLDMDIHKCYPSVSRDVISRMLRRYCADKRMLALMEMYNQQTEDMPIGDYLSQQWINPVLMPLIRFIREELKPDHVFDYIDNIDIIHSDRAELKEMQWRIMHWAWYNLGLLFNPSRQIFKLGRRRTERGLDRAGYVYRHGSTLMRKRIKQSFARRRHNAKSVTSYQGIAMHCDARNLTDKLLNRDNDMDLSSLVKAKIERPFEGDAIKIEAIIDRPIEVLDFTVSPSERKPNTDYLKMQIRFEGKKRFVGGGYQFLCQVLKQIDKSNLPLQTIIRNKRGYYFDGTIEEE